MSQKDVRETNGERALCRRARRMSRVDWARQWRSRISRMRTEQGEDGRRGKERRSEVEPEKSVGRR